MLSNVLAHRECLWIEGVGVGCQAQRVMVEAAAVMLLPAVQVSVCWDVYQLQTSRHKGL